MDTLGQLADLLGIEEPVSFREFVSGKDYCNNPYLYEYWYEQEEKTDVKISELILDGSLGGGKSTFAAYYFAYRVFLLFYGGSPQIQLGLPENSDIYCLYFSVSINQAKQSGYQLIYDIFETCKWFKENAPINKELKSTVEFVGRHFYIKYASGEGHQIGLNVWGFILDEANFRGEGVGNGVEEQYAEVTQLYTQLIDRQLSRFANEDCTVDALAILVSSASYQSSFVEQRKALVKGDKSARIITSAAYEVKPHRFSKEKFEVFIGSGTVEPCIIESEEQRLKILNSAGILGTGEEEAFFRKVPMNLLKSFKTNIILAIQNHCGVSTMMSSSFMSNMTYLYKSYVDLPKMFQSEFLEASTEDDTELIEYLLVSNIEYADRPHSLFLDLSVQHDTGSLTAYRYDGTDEKGSHIHTRAFSLKFIPPAFPAQTEITKIKRFIVDLAQYINIVAFASDQYQSTQLRQEINDELGLQDVRISIDSSDIPHIHWQKALVSGRIRQERDETLEREVKEAVHDWKKHRVLKARGSSDDTLQSNVGAFFLSDTQGREAGTLEDLYGPRANLVGGKSISKVLKSLGYV